MPQFTNQAQLSYNGSIINSNVAVGEILDVLSITKTAVSDDYTRNSDVTYVISIVNSGDTPYTNLTITDNLGAYTFDGETLYPLTYVEGSAIAYVNGVLVASPSVTAGPPLEFTGITVPANGNLIIVYEVDVNQFAPLDVDDSIENTVAVSGAGISGPVTDTETITPEQEPDLTITKTIDPVPVTENGTVTYTFIIQNYGNTAATAEDDVTLTDTFDPILTDITVTFNGTTWTEGVNYNYDEETGLFATIPGQITVPAATYTRDENGSWIINPGVSELVVTGTI